MNVFGFLAVIIICVTIIGVVLLLCHKSITITHIHKDITEQPKPEERPTMGFSVEEKDKQEKEINKDIAQIGMDAVITAANKLMGIDVEEVDNGRKE